MALTIEQKKQLEKTHTSGALGIALKKTKKLTGLAALNQSNAIKSASSFEGSSFYKNTPPLLEKNEISEKLNLDTFEKVIYIDPLKIRNWSFHDRPESELGDITSLANELKTIGQQQPCIVRKIDSHEHEYEVIAGERRWRAALSVGIKLKAIVKNLNDYEAAICQAAENAHRKDLSDYAKGINYSKLISAGIVTEQSLIDILGISQPEISRLLSFSKVPSEIWETIGDTSLISARTSAEIRSIIKKGDIYLEAVKKLAPKLKTGKFGAHKLKNAVEKIINGNTGTFNGQEIRSRDGRHLFTWRKDSNGNLSISFPKDIREFIKKDYIENSLKKAIESLITSVFLEEKNTTKQ